MRFRSPESPKPWTGVRAARHFGASAPQPGPVTPFLRGISPASSSQSEDCLTLNVWTPSRQGAPRPVLVWIHGGAFAIGTSSTRLYGGRRLAARGDVVVVSINYRLGALGFLNLRALRPGDPGLPANLGLQDQIAALEWIRDNIDAFGGDPHKVTLFGESAGGMSVSTLLGTPRARGLFHRAIAQSGAAHHVSSSETAGTLSERFLEELELSRPDPEALRKLPLQELIRVQSAMWQRVPLALGQLPWQPSLDGDVLPEQPLDAIGAGASQDIPLLVGTNRDEWKLFMLADRAGRRLDRAGLRERLERAFRGREKDGQALGELAFHHYRTSDPDRPSSAPRERWAAFQSDRVFHIPALRLLERHAAHTRASYAYLFSWTPPLLGSRVGACHGLEIPFVFGTAREPLLRPVMASTPGARQLAARMQESWLAFARTGHPGTSALPFWPRFEPEARPTMIFDAHSRVSERPFESVVPFWRGVM
jgi:para-nitrobenzyl esterase